MTNLPISLKLPYSLDGIVLNLPGLLAQLPQEAYMTEFVPIATEDTPAPEDTSLPTEENALPSDL